MSAPTLAGSTLAQPKYDHDGEELQSRDIAAQHELASGGLVQDFVASRYRWTLRWEGITDAQVATIMSAYATALSTASTFTPTTTGSYTVFAVPGSFSRTYVIDGSNTRRWRAQLTVEETT